jgi:hypothetical protein
MAVIKRRPVEVFSMSFLDVISCGFGAVILLLVLALALEPATLEHISADLSDLLAARKQSFAESSAEADAMEQEVEARRAELSLAQSTLDQLSDELLAAEAEAETESEAERQAVLQALTEEMKRILSRSTYEPPAKDAVIGGIPVDSEYIIFIIDTSGSMIQAAWPLVVKKVEQVLEVHPEVKGLQVVNDMGRYMFAEYAGRWIKDTPARRREVLKRLRTWRSFSNSSPVEGITHAVRLYSQQEEQVSLYVFGDDFSSGSIDPVLRRVHQINRKSRVSGRPLVRVHAFGFPVLFAAQLHASDNIRRFSHLMRLLAEQNAGSFVGLSTLSD